MASLDKTRCMSGEVQQLNKETYTWNTEDEWREKERQRRSKREREEDGDFQSVKNGRKKGDGLLKKNGRNCKQSELKTGGEMEVNEGEVSEVVGVVKLSETEVCTEDQEKDESVTVGVKLIEKVDFCLWLIHLWFQGG